MTTAGSAGSGLRCVKLPDVLGGIIEAVQPLLHNGGNAASGGVWRVRGPRGTAVLKVALPPGGAVDRAPGWPTSDAPAHWNYWRREVLAYTTGFAATAYAAQGIAPPALLEFSDRPDGSAELWLADAGGTPGTSWSSAAFGDFARRLGAAQARWAGQVPDLPWLSRQWLAQYLAAGPARHLQGDLGDEYWDHPLAAAWPAQVRQRLRRLWHDRGQMLAAAQATEQTLCHLDVWPPNMIAGDAGTVLLDWSFAGQGGIGEDAANLIVDSVADGMIDAAQLPEITAAITDGYLAGLADGGWTGPADDTRRAIAVCGAAKYVWFAPLLLRRVIRDGTPMQSVYVQDTSPAAALERLRGLITLLADWATAALP